LQTQIEGVGSQVKEISESLKLLQSAVPSFMIYVSNIAARFALTKDRIVDISRKWTSGILDEKILDLFNFSITKDCSLSLMTSLLSSKTFIEKYQIQYLNPK
jgi:archaellum component FlaC